MNTEITKYLFYFRNSWLLCKKAADWGTMVQFDLFYQNHSPYYYHIYFLKLELIQKYSLLFIVVTAPDKG